MNHDETKLEPRQLTGKTALVTGSTSGIGQAIALEFARNGARVLLHGRRPSSHALDVQKQIQDMGGGSHLLFCDFSDNVQRSSFVQDAWATFGGIDILCNNAGGDVLTGDAAEYGFREKLEYLFRVDVETTLELSRDIGAMMCESMSGRDCETASIINVGWDQALQGMEGDSGEMFATTKGAIMAMTKSLAQSLAPKVRVNCIAPGWIQTKWGDQASEKWSSRAIRQSLLNRWGGPRMSRKWLSFLQANNLGS